jgi:hypothetical protein
VKAYFSERVFKMRAKVEKRKKKYKTNPFIASMPRNTKRRVKLYQRGDMTMALFKNDTGEILENQIAGFWEAKEVDSEKFLKLYVNGVKALAELTSPGAKVFEVLYRKMQDAKERDQIYMNFHTVDQDETPMSETTYWRGMNELIEKGFLATSHLPSLFWINPDFVWNGDRLAFVKQYYKAGSPAAMQLREQLRRERQTDLPFNEPEQEDDTYSAELEAQDPFFNRATQAELVRRAKEMDAGINCAVHEIIED